MKSNEEKKFRHGIQDTDAKTIVQMDRMLRKMSNTERFARTLKATDWVLKASEMAVKKRYSHLPKERIDELIVLHRYGPEVYKWFLRRHEFGKK